MTDPLATTFELLASTRNLHAVDALIPALDVDSEAIRASATDALIQRSSTRGQVEVIRRLESLSPQVRSVVERKSSQMGKALKQCLMNGDTELQTNGLGIVRLTENYEQVPTMLKMLLDPANELHELTAQTIHDLSNRLYEHCNFSQDSKPKEKYLRNAQRVRHDVLSCFDQACTDFANLSHPQDVVESILALGDVDHFSVQKVLGQANSACRQLADQTLIQSSHPGVMQLILDFMSKNYPYRMALEAIKQRDDPEFVCHMLRWFPKRLSQLQAKNFQQLDSVAWLDPSGRSLETIPPALQEPLVSFVSSTSVPYEHKVSVQQWLLQHGTPEGRTAAADVLATLDDSTVHSIVVDSLDAEDEEVQAWATGQLRSQAIPETFSLLIERLSSPMQAVREAAREELQSFNIARMLDLFEEVDPEVCRRAGALIEKISPDCIAELRNELADPMRRRKIRAARAALALGLHTRVVPSLIEMLEDSDPLVRRTAVEVLGTIASDQIVESLERHRNDSSPRVREAVDKVLEQIRRHELGETALSGVPQGG